MRSDTGKAMRKTRAVVLLALVLAGCGPEYHYVVEDAQTQRKYLTTEYHRDADGPGISFKDELTGDRVTVYAPVLKALSPDDYDHAKRTGVLP
jgi:hypothetical protein